MNHVHDSCFGYVILMIHSLYLISYLNSLYNQKKKYFFLKQKQNLKKKITCMPNIKYLGAKCSVLHIEVCVVEGTPALLFIFFKLNFEIIVDSQEVAKIIWRDLMYSSPSSPVVIS